MPQACIFLSKGQSLPHMSPAHCYAPGVTQKPEQETTEALTVTLFPKYQLCALPMFIINYPVPTIVQLCAFLLCLLSTPADFPTLLSPAFLIYH